MASASVAPAKEPQASPAPAATTEVDAKDTKEAPPAEQVRYDLASTSKIQL
jgi:hypothetical protein